MATLDPNTKGALLKFTNGAKAIIYNEQRLRQLLPMLESRHGAMQAVQTIMSVIEQKKPIPPAVAPYLAVNIYMLLVDMAHNITGEDPDKEIVKSVVAELLTMVSGTHPEEQETMQAESGEPAPEQAQEQQAGTEIPMQGVIGRAMGG